MSKKNNCGICGRLSESGVCDADHEQDSLWPVAEGWQAREGRALFSEAKSIKRGNNCDVVVGDGIDDPGALRDQEIKLGRELTVLRLAFAAEERALREKNRPPAPEPLQGISWGMHICQVLAILVVGCALLAIGA